MLTKDEIDRELANPDFFDNPYPTFHRVRELGPAYRSEAWGAWLLTGLDEVSQMFRDWKHFSSEGRGLTMLNHLTDDERRRVEPLGRFMALGGGLISSDPPVHTRIRGLVSKTFTSRVVETLRPKVQSMVDDLLDRVVDAGNMELLRAVALPLPATVIAEMLGVPSDDQVKFVEWSDAALAMDGTGTPALPLVERTQSGYLSLANYFGDLVVDRRSSPTRLRTDLLSTLINAQDGNELSDHELVVTCLTILMGGFETTTSLIVNTLHLLLANPDQRTAAQRDPTLMASAVEEGLRYESPIQIVMRRVNEPLLLGPARLAPNELVFAMVGAANRDPRHFAEPDRFEITRDGRHVTFGAGIHFCIGAPLARMEAPIAIETILRRMPNITFVEDRVHWNTAKPSARMPLHYNVEF